MDVVEEDASSKLFLGFDSRREEDRDIDLSWWDLLDFAVRFLSLILESSEWWLREEVWSSAWSLAWSSLKTVKRRDLLWSSFEIHLRFDQIEN